MKNLDEAIEIDGICSSISVITAGLDMKEEFQGEVFLLRVIIEKLKSVAERLVVNPPGNDVNINLAADTSSRVSSVH